MKLKSVKNKVWDQACKQADNYFWFQVRFQVENQVENQVRIQVWNQVWNQIYHEGYDDILRLK